VDSVALLELPANIAMAAAAASTAASASTTIVAEPGPSLSQRSGFTEESHDNTFVTTCHKCGEYVSEPVIDVINRLRTGRLHIRCRTQQCNTIVCHSSSLASNAVYSDVPAADTVR